MTDLEKIKKCVFAVSKLAAPKVSIADIIIESDRYDDGDDFLRIIIEVEHSELANDAEYEALLEAVEQAVGEIDRRYPSVRFSDAA